MEKQTKPKVLLAKMGLDCHDTGITTMAHLLRDWGYETIYMGLHNPAEKILNAAVEEDVDAIGLSFLSGQHLLQTKKLLKLMKEQNLEIPVILGGVIPKYDISALKEAGVSEVFTPGTMSGTIAEYLKKFVS